MNKFIFVLLLLWQYSSGQDCQTKLLQVTVDNQNLKLEVLKLQSVNQTITAKYVNALNNHQKLLTQGNSIIERIDLINQKIAKQSTPESNFGIGLGYYFSNLWEVQTLIYFGDPFIIAGIIPNNSYGKFGVGTQFNSKFSGSIFINTNLKEQSEVNLGVGIMMNVLQGLKFELSTDSKFGAKMGINFVI